MQTLIAFIYNRIYKLRVNIQLKGLSELQEITESLKLYAKLYVGSLFRQVSRDFIRSSRNLQVKTKTQQYNNINQQEIK